MPHGASEFAEKTSATLATLAPIENKGFFYRTTSAKPWRKPRRVGDGEANY
jgi:hypothetical protein